MFAITSLEPQPRGVVLSFKATPEDFFEYQEQEGVIPAPYMARNQWLALERFDALRDDELRDLLAISYRLVFERLPKRLQQSLAGESSTRAVAKKKSPKKQSKKMAQKRAKATSRRNSAGK